MRLIQPVLILLFGVGTFLYFRFGRTRAFDRLIMVILALSGILMIIDPDLTTNLANLIGVGRGADLLVYFGFTMTFFVALFLYSKLRGLESRLTELVRAIAIKDAFDRLPPVNSNEMSQLPPTE